MEINVLRVEGIASILVSLPQKNTSKLGKRNFISETKQKKLVDDMSNERNHEIVQKKTLLMILNKDLVKILFVSLLSKTDI